MSIWDRNVLKKFVLVHVHPYDYSYDYSSNQYQYSTEYGNNILYNTLCLNTGWHGDGQISTDMKTDARQSVRRTN